MFVWANEIQVDVVFIDVYWLKSNSIGPNDCCMLVSHATVTHWQLKKASVVETFCFLLMYSTLFAQEFVGSGIP